MRLSDTYKRMSKRKHILFQLSELSREEIDQLANEAKLLLSFNPMVIERALVKPIFLAMCSKLSLSDLHNLETCHPWFYNRFRVWNVWKHVFMERNGGVNYKTVTSDVFHTAPKMICPGDTDWSVVPISFQDTIEKRQAKLVSKNDMPRLDDAMYWKRYIMALNGRTARNSHAIGWRVPMMTRVCYSAKSEYVVGSSVHKWVMDAWGSAKFNGRRLKPFILPGYDEIKSDIINVHPSGLSACFALHLKKNRCDSYQGWHVHLL